MINSVCLSLLIERLIYGEGKANKLKNYLEYGSQRFGISIGQNSKYVAHLTFYYHNPCLTGGGQKNLASLQKRHSS